MAQVAPPLASEAGAWHLQEAGRRRWAYQAVVGQLGGGSHQTTPSSRSPLSLSLGPVGEEGEQERSAPPLLFTFWRNGGGSEGKSGRKRENKLLHQLRMESVRKDR